jgi:hypothetical protein
VLGLPGFEVLAVSEYAGELAVHTLGVDETAFRAATPTAGTVFATGIVALNGRARLLDVIEGRSGKVLCDWVSGREPEWRDQIRPAGWRSGRRCAGMATEPVALAGVVTR